MAWPTCPYRRSNCRFAKGFERTTAIAWTPEYDREGNLLNKDPNVRYCHIWCLECGSEWERTEDANGYKDKIIGRK